VYSPTFVSSPPTASLGTEESQTYGSPMNMTKNSNWQWSNFTWSNCSVVAGTRIVWRIYYNDTVNNQNATDIQVFDVVPIKIIITLNSNRTNSVNQIVVRPNTAILLYGNAYYNNGSAFANSPIYFNYSTTPLGNNNTDSNGNYIFTFSIPYTGNYTLVARANDAQGSSGYNTTVLYVAATPSNVKYRLSYHFGTDASNDVEKTGNYNETVDALSVSRFFYSSDSNLAHAYTCTYDSSEYSAQLLSLIHSYQRNNLNYINFTANAALTDYTEEVSQKIAGSSLLIAYTKGTCNVVDNSMYLVESNQIPSRPFASFSFGTPSEIPFLIRAKYDKIALNGTDVFGSGTNVMCIRKVAISSNYYPVESVKRC
jgi:hypothetical protein